MAYARAKLFWGAIDVVRADEAPYASQQVHPMGEDANPPGIGVRRAQIVFTRTGITPPQDVVTTHLDIQNFTNGVPDDTWNETDFTQAEAALNTGLVSSSSLWGPGIVVDQLRWYRIGPGIVPPNPAVRITDLNVAGAGSNHLPSQVAATVTLKTAVRAAWGRMYLPVGTTSMMDQQGFIVAAAVQQLFDAWNACLIELQSHDLHCVVYSKTRRKAYTVEHTQVDNVWDVIRSRRYAAPTQRLVSP